MYLSLTLGSRPPANGFSRTLRRRPRLLLLLLLLLVMLRLRLLLPLLIHLRHPLLGRALHNII
jgi:hypothetical protein